MSRADLHADIIDAMAGVILRRVENRIKGMRPDTSATAPEHIVGYEAGFKVAKREMLEMLAEVQDGEPK